MTADISQFVDHQYLNLETYKKNGQAVATPVWFVIDNDSIYIATKAGTGKVKRLRNNQNVRVMPCGFRGEPKGEWVDGKARFADPQESEQAISLRNKKYGMKAKLAGFFSYGKGEFVVIAVKLDSQS
jgi:hypothetical protein